MAQRSTYPLIDRLLDGKLEEKLRAWRAAGVTFDDIALLLRDDEVRVSRSTLARWCHDLGIEAAA